MKNILLTKEILKPNNFLANTDLKDAFHSAPIAKRWKKYPQSIYDNKLYQFCVIPFRISTIPQVFPIAMYESL